MSNKNKTAVLGVIFEKNRRFIDQYLASLERQTDKKFDLILINDGFLNFRSYKNKYELKIKELKCSGSYSRIRKFGICYAKNEGYDYIIFTDTDDFFANNRVNISRELLEKYDIVVNDLVLVSLGGGIIGKQYISNRLRDGSEISFDFIKDKNIYGFTNTSLRLRCLKNSLCFGRRLVAVDWFLFSMLLKQGCSSVFTNKTESFYRLYAGNLAGLSGGCEAGSIESGIIAKYWHYKYLAKIKKEFSGLFSAFSDLREKFISSKIFKAQYCKKIANLKIVSPLWWEKIKLPEELGLCE